MRMSDAEKQAAYKLRHPEKVRDNCGCGKLKMKIAAQCKQCYKNNVARGVNSPYWKGGYQRKLYNNQKRTNLLKTIEGSHTNVEWELLKNKYGNICLCCKKQEPFVVLRRDHIVPITKGGTDYISNIQPLCDLCNSRKYNKIISYLEPLKNVGDSL